MNLHDPGFLQTSGFSTGFANDKYTSAVSSASGYNFELVCDDPRNTVHQFLITVKKEKTEEEMGNLANTVEMASLDAGWWSESESCG